MIRPVSNVPLLIALHVILGLCHSDKIIRHRACDLRDVAYALIDSELDWDFEEKCKEIKVWYLLRFGGGL